MVEYEKQEVMHGDACVICGDIVHGQPIPYVQIEAEEPEEDDRETVSIIPARELYRQHRGAESVLIHGLYLEFNFQFLNSQSKQVKMQAWQYVKACVRLMKEMNRWITWKDFPVGSEAWDIWLEEHPEDREDMLAHREYHIAMAERAQELMAGGMAPEDAREKIRKEAISGGTF
jgi:hypothetical protein